MKPAINGAIEAALESCESNTTNLCEAIYFVIGYIGHNDPALADLLTQLIAKTK